MQFQADLIAKTGGATANVHSAARHLMYDGADGDLNDRKAATPEIFFRDETGLTVNLTASKAVVVTYEVQGTAGGWTLDLLQLLVETIK